MCVCRRAVQSSRDIWRSLLRHDVGMDDIVAGAKRIRRMEVAAEGAYKAALERYPDQPRILSVR